MKHVNRQCVEGAIGGCRKKLSNPSLAETAQICNHKSKTQLSLQALLGLRQSVQVVLIWTCPTVG